MRRIVVAAAIIAVAGLTGWRTGTPTPGPDEAAVRAAVDHYLKGIMLYDQADLDQAFWPEAHIMAWTGRGLFDSPYESWKEFTERGDPPSDTTGYVNTIVSVDIAGNAAVVKTDLQWPTVHYVDYLSLLKIDGEWRIVNKIFHAER